MKTTFISILCLVTCFAYSQYDPVTIYTPKGVAVDAIQLSSSDFDVATRTYWDNYWLEDYGGVQVLELSTLVYNCHGYAWHNIELPGIPYNYSKLWINDLDQNSNPIHNVTKYFSYEDSDGKQSYRQTSNTVEKLKVSYGTRDHSAITTSDPNYFISKWSWGPLVRHRYNNCPFYPGSTIKYYKLNPKITGSSAVLCGGGQRTFAHDLTHAMPQWSYSWNSTGDLSYVSGGSSNYIVQADSYGEGLASVSLNVTTNSGHQSSATQTIGVNYPGWGIIYPEDGSELCGNEYYTISADISAYFDVTDYDWYPYGMSILYGQGTNHIEVRTDYSFGSAGVDLMYENACGVWDDYVTYYENYWCSGYYLLYPNPADDFVEITSNASLNKTEDTSSADLFFTKGIMRILDSYGRVYSTIELQSDKQRMSTSHLKDGVYILEISTKSHMERLQLVVKH